MQPSKHLQAQSGQAPMSVRIKPEARTPTTINTTRGNNNGNRVVANNGNRGTGVKRVFASTPLPPNKIGNRIGGNNRDIPSFFRQRLPPSLQPATTSSSLSSQTWLNSENKVISRKQTSTPIPSRAASGSADPKRKLNFVNSQAATSWNNIGTGTAIRRLASGTSSSSTFVGSGQLTKRVCTSSNSMLRNVGGGGSLGTNKVAPKQQRKISVTPEKKPKLSNETNLCPLCPNSKEYSQLNSVMRHLRVVHKLVDLHDTKPVEVANLVISMVEATASEIDGEGLLVTGSTGDDESSTVHLMKAAEPVVASKSTPATTSNQSSEPSVVVPLAEGIQKVQEMLRSRKNEVNAKFQELLKACLTKEDIDMVEDSLDSAALHL